MGWTNEADLFDGPGTDENEVCDLTSSNDSVAQAFRPQCLRLTRGRSFSFLCHWARTRA